MTSPGASLKLLDSSPLARELDLASELFHRINRVIPEEQALFTVGPETTVRSAVTQMRRLGYSQVPVVARGSVLGVFSFRSFAVEAATVSLEEIRQQRCALGDLEVTEFLEPFQFARVEDEMRSVFEAIERDNGVLVGTPDRLVGILTPMDFLQYLYKVSRPFVLLSEIELAVRALIRLALTEGEIVEACGICLAAIYRGAEKVPSTLEELTFDNYQVLIGYTKTWPKFQLLLGGARERTAGKLREIRDLRNDVFHFRRELRAEDHQALEVSRYWLLNKVRLAEASSKAKGA